MVPEEKNKNQVRTWSDTLKPQRSTIVHMTKVNIRGANMQYKECSMSWGRFGSSRPPVKRNYVEVVN